MIRLITIAFALTLAISVQTMSPAPLLSRTASSRKSVKHAFGATTASAAIVCNEEGDCWKTKERYTYPPKAGVRIYADDWQWGPKDKYRWRETRPGPGYWSKGVWIGF